MALPRCGEIGTATEGLSGTLTGPHVLTTFSSVSVWTLEEYYIWLIYSSRRGGTFLRHCYIKFQDPQDYLTPHLAKNQFSSLRWTVLRLKIPQGLQSHLWRSRTEKLHLSHGLTLCTLFLKNNFSKRFYLFSFRERREKERERNINVWLPFTWPPLGTWPATQACALTENRTGDPLVHSPCSINLLSYTSQGCTLVI